MAEKQNTPEIRFAGFTDPWEQRKWSEYVSISTDMVDPRSGNYDNLPHVGPGNMESFTGRLYDNVNTVKDDALISGKFHFDPGDIIYGKINPQLGKYTYAQFEGLASADAYVLNGKNGLTQEFLFGILQTKAFFDYSVSVSMRSGMPKINRDELNAFEFLAPNESEQRAIGDILLKLDDLITLHQRKYDKLCAVKKSMLDKMFPKPGETKPEIRFDGFTDPWEQRKLGELGFAQSGIGFPDAEQGGTEGTPFFKVSDMNTPGNEYELVASNNYVTAEQIARMGWRPINQVPAIFFAKVGAAVMLNRKRLVNEPFLLDNNTMAFSMDSSLLDTQFGRSLFERLDLTSLIQVGALPSFNSSDVESISVSLPSTMNEQRQIGQYLYDLNTLITLHQREPRFADTG